MATVIRPRRRRGGLRRSVPLLYLALAMLAAVLVLPTALRPPPDPTTESGAISPDAPPDDNPEQLIQSNQQASGGGAGAAGGTSTTTTPGTPGAPAPIVTTTTLATKAGSGLCFGNPKRQTESVYAGPCAPGFAGDNGGATAKFVLPNEVRLGFHHGATEPTVGRVSETPRENENGTDRTMRVLQQYFNQRFETYGRKLAFYGLPKGTKPEEQSAAAAAADEEMGLFGSFNIYQGYCEDVARRGQVVLCNPATHEVYLRNRPGFFSWQMDLTQMQGFAAEYVCKKLVGKPAAFAGADSLGTKGRPRKITLVTEVTEEGGISMNVFRDAFKRECNGELVSPVQFASGADPGTAGAVSRWAVDGVTTVVLGTQAGNTILLQTAASSQGYQPEWVLTSNFGLDFNIVGTLLPKDQAAHTFGVSGWEIAQPPQSKECYRAYHSIDPDNDPDDGVCTNFWHPMMVFADGIQGAGPRLTRDAFQKALFALGYRYGQAPWSIGGGYGPDDYSYMDSVGEIWWDSTADNPENGVPGAYRWTHRGTRWKRGQQTADVSELFTAGISAPPPS